MKRIFERVAADPVPYAFRIAMVAIVCLIGIAYCARSSAASVAIATIDSISITLTDEPCKLKAVSNLPYRAHWREQGRVYEGCFQVNPQGFVVAYFDDRSVALIPVQHFRRAEAL
jgi:hypothetical protein